MINSDNLNQFQDSPDEEQRIASAIKLAGRRPCLPEATKSLASEAFRASLEVASKKKLNRDRWLQGLMSVACALVIILGYYVVYPVYIQDMELAAEITFVEGVTEIIDVDVGNETVSLDTDIQVGSTLKTAPDSYAELNYFGADVRLNEQTSIQIFADHIFLLSGQIYIDSDESTAPVVVRNWLAEIQDIGTQFVVEVSERGLVTSVRTGEILVEVDGSDYRAKATDEFAESLSISSTQQVQQSFTNKDNPDWSWITQASQAFVLEGSTLSDYLDWVSGETGYRIVYENPGVALAAQTLVLHGNITNLHPNDHIEAVLSSADLEVDRSEVSAYIIGSASGN